MAGSDIIVLNSFEAATDLLDKRSRIYSSRPHATMLMDVVISLPCSYGTNHQLFLLFFPSSWDRDLVLMPYGNDLKAHRKLFHQEFHPNRHELHRPQEKKALRVFLNNLLETPENWTGHIKHMIGGTILSVAYGIEVQPQNDPDLLAVERMTSVMNEAGVPGAFLVDTFPILKYVPSWFPGASFKRKAKAWKGILSETITPPFMRVKEAMINDNAKDSFSLRCLRNAKHADPRHSHLSDEEEIIKETAGTMYKGGADSGVTALHTFILLMLCFPQVQQEAQEELDRVVDPDRLPDYEDRSSLPYLTAALYECLRWQPVAPLAIHRVDKDDTYRGYHIPKHAVVIPNIYSAHEFEPKRWLRKDPDSERSGAEQWILDPNIRDPTAVAFGFGRRVCPGRHMALSTLWVNAASLLHSFNITKGIDEDGKSIEPKVEYVSGVLNNPAPFRCMIKPRSHRHAELIKQTLAMALE
ncbi:hypothetical protein GYMLUDRAFT_239787 [Collybiopsis luxurians FD-317 M1]|nr:hypothetical protein GYMLUDRAFT_239787 [Collybiopsis luxurians FD-317 M1]